MFFVPAIHVLFGRHGNSVRPRGKEGDSFGWHSRPNQPDNVIVENGININL